MSENFNPSDYSSFGELPEDQRSNYEPLEDGRSFVLATVEKNPETAHRLAVIEDRAVNALNQAVDSEGLTYDEILQRYWEHCKSWNFDGKKETLESLKQFSDRDILQGRDYDPAFLEACKKSYTEPTYSKKLQGIYLEEIDSSDLEVVSNLLKDKKFSQKKELVDLINKEDVWALYEQVKNDIVAVKAIVRNIEDNQLKIDILKAQVPPVAVTKEMENGDPVFKHVNEIKSSIATSLIESHEYDSAISLVREGYLETKQFKYLLHRIESDQFLSDLAKESNSSDDAVEIMRFIADENLLLQIADGGGKDFPKIFGDPIRKTVVQYAKKLHGSLTSKPEIYQADRLAGQNKFVFGIPSDQDQVYIGWSNTGSHEYHKNIFNSMSRRYGIEFPDKLRSGGYIEVKHGGSECPVGVTFNSSSGDFGNYSHRIMEKFQDQISEALRSHLNADNVELEIEVSH